MSKEIEFVALDDNIVNDVSTNDLQNILNKIIQINSEKNVHASLRYIEIKILYSLMVKMGLKFNNYDKIKNFEKYLEFIAEILRQTEEQYSLSGWILFKFHIDYLRSKSVWELF